MLYPMHCSSAIDPESEVVGDLLDECIGKRTKLKIKNWPSLDYEKV
jgi:hypothetical protein